MSVEQSPLPTSLPQAAPATDALRVEDVFKIYKEGSVETVALRGASLSIAKGERVALLGRSGSGKSTLLNLISGLDTPSAGRIWLRGEDISRLDVEARTRLRGEAMGIVLQNGNLLPFLSAKENIELPILLHGGTPSDARARSSHLLDLVGLGNRAGHGPSELSGGEQQRVAIATALSNQPDIILADELTGELDSETATAILDLLDTVNTLYQTSFLIITHNPEVSRRAQRSLRIQDGQVFAHAT